MRNLLTLFFGIRSNSLSISPPPSVSNFALSLEPISSRGRREGSEKSGELDDNLDLGDADRKSTSASVSKSGLERASPCSVAKTLPKPEEEDAGEATEEEEAPPAPLAPPLPSSLRTDLRLPVLLPKANAHRLRPARGLEEGVLGADDLSSSLS